MLEMDWNTISFHLIFMGISYCLALPIGWNRERNSHSAGLRTFPLVAVATCGFILVGIDVLDGDVAQSRVMEGVITGIGFIGGGAILKNSNTVSGTATAASLWATCAIGVAVAWQRFEIALVLSVVTFLTLQLMPEIKPLVKSGSDSDSNSDSKS